MKKIFFTILSVMIISVSANAQSSDVSKADKEAKALAKEKQNKELEDALKQAGITEAEALKFKATTQIYNAKSSEIRKNAALSEEEKATQLKANMEEKNTKLKEIVGEEKYRAYNKVRKAQKEAAEATKGN
jgi:outer membrane cobalamin receptor